MSKTRKRPYTNKELFNIIVNKIKEEGSLPDILDYYKPDSREQLIKTYEWEVSADLHFGGNEGIYLDLYIEGNLGDDLNEIWLGTFKTLRDDLAALKEMAILQAHFIWYCRKFVNDNIDDFEWTGYRVQFFKGEKKTMDYSTQHINSANNLIKRNYKYDWDYVILINNATQKEKKIKREDVVLD